MEREQGKRVTRKYKDFPRDLDVATAFGKWVLSFCNSSETSPLQISGHEAAYGCYHPANYQARALTGVGYKPHTLLDFSTLSLFRKSRKDLSVLPDVHYPADPNLEMATANLITSLTWFGVTRIFRCIQVFVLGHDQVYR